MTGWLLGFKSSLPKTLLIRRYQGLFKSILSTNNEAPAFNQQKDGCFHNLSKTIIIINDILSEHRMTFVFNNHVSKKHRINDKKPPARCVMVWNILGMKIFTCLIIVLLFFDSYKAGKSLNCHKIYLVVSL